MIRFSRIVFFAIVTGPGIASASLLQDSRLLLTLEPGYSATVYAETSADSSPFLYTQELSIPGNAASATYDFEWDSTGGRFDITTSLEHAENVASSYAWSVGSLSLLSPTPLLVSGVIALNYDFPMHLMNLNAGFGITATEPFDVLLNQFASVGTSDDMAGPWMGQHSVAFDDLEIPANERVSVGYTILMTTSGADASASVDGSIHLDVVTIPEPQSVVLLAAVAVALMGRRSRAIHHPLSPTAGDR